MVWIRGTRLFHDFSREARVSLFCWPQQGVYTRLIRQECRFWEKRSICIYIYRIDWISQKRQRVPRGTSLEEYFFFVFPLLFSFVSRYVTNIKIRRVRFFSKKRFSPNFYGIVKILVETCFGKARKNTVRPVTRTVNVHAFLTSSYCHFNGVFKASNRSSRGGPSRASFPI